MRALQNFFFQPDEQHAAAGGPGPAAQLALKTLARLRVGSLSLTLPDGQSLSFGEGAPHAHLTLSCWSVCDAVLAGGDVGFAETYLDRKWHTDDLAALLDVVVRNRAQFDAIIYGSWWGRLAQRVRHWTRRNSRAGSRRNIHAHYDLGNAFYQLWLDASMTYSSALFTDRANAAMTLEAAQHAKYARIVRQLQLPHDAEVLEIGCGWGGFAQIAASAHGARVTGLTLSTEQLDYARQRMRAAGLEDRVALRLQDYRDVEGQFDAVASIEMFEAVGEAYWDDYFACVARSLRPGGRACIQTIVIDDALFARYRKGSDFIQQYVFPGGMLPSRSAFTAAAARAGLTVTDAFAFGSDYARTLRAWRDALHARLADVSAQGFDERFVRLWNFYLAYCEAAFANGDTDVVQFTLAKASGPV